MDVTVVARSARGSATATARATAREKNAVLRIMADKLGSGKRDIVSANRADIEEAEAEGVAANLVHRLSFGEAKIDARIRSLHEILALPDPVGQTSQIKRRPGGLQVAGVGVPLGVILMIYEARPHVTVNAGGLCLKSANAVILRGGSEAKRCGG